MIRKLYEILRLLTPKSVHGIFTGLLYTFRIKPTVNKRVRSTLKKGVIVLSADFEMAWAFRYSKTRGHEAEKHGLIERENTEILIELFEKYKIPVTWATVGHLFLDSCEADEHSLPHPEMPRPGYFENKNWDFSSGDWYQHDPCSTLEKSPAWYAADLLEKITGSMAGHEIGCHTFSHIDCTEKNCPPDLFKAEINKCKEIAGKHNLQLKSMVFPGGTHGNLALLKELGFTNYRKAGNYHVDLPLIDPYGLVQIPSSYPLDISANKWSKKRYINIARSFIKSAERHRLVTHLWFHPSMNQWYLKNVIPSVLESIYRLKEQGNIEVLTMGQLAERFLED